MTSSAAELFFLALCFMIWSYTLLKLDRIGSSDHMRLFPLFTIPSHATHPLTRRAVFFLSQVISCSFPPSLFTVVSLDFENHVAWASLHSSSFPPKALVP